MPFVTSGKQDNYLVDAMSTDFRRNFAEKTTIHGISDFFEASNKWVKCFWIFVILLAAVATFVEIYFSVVNYLRSPLLTTFSIVLVQEMRMPLLYVCPNTAVNDRKISYRNEYDFVNEFFNGPPGDDDDDSASTKVLSSKRGNSEYFAPPNLNVPPPPPPPPICLPYSDNGTCVDHATYPTFPPLPPTPSPLPEMETPVRVWEFFDSIALSVDDFFLECSSRNRARNCSDFITPMFDMDYGRCFLVDASLKQIQPGKSLELVVDSKSNTKMTSLTSGVVVAIVDRYNPLKISLDKFYVGPGTFSKILLQATNYKQLNVDIGETKQECLDANEVTDIKYTFVNLSADQWSCELECSLHISRNMCNCILPFDKSVIKREHWSSVCTYGEYLKCLKETSTSKTHDQEMKKCGSKCVPLCDWWSYSYSISATPLDFNFPMALERMNATGKAADAFRYNIRDQIVLNIAFAELQYNEISQSLSMTGDTMLSNIGGQIGLWLGASLLSVIQLLVFVISWLMKKLNGNPKPVSEMNGFHGNKIDPKLSVHSIV